MLARTNVRYRPDLAARADSETLFVTGVDGSPADAMTASFVNVSLDRLVSHISVWLQKPSTAGSSRPSVRVPGKARKRSLAEFRGNLWPPTAPNFTEGRQEREALPSDSTCRASKKKKRDAQWPCSTGASGGADEGRRDGYQPGL